MEQRSPAQLVTDEQARLEHELRELPPDAWSMPSRCEGWSTLQVLAHLVAGAELYHDSVTRALSGDAGTPAGPDGRELTVEDVRLWLSRRQETVMQQGPVEILDRFCASGQALVELYRRLSPEDFDTPAWHPRGTLTIGTLVTFRVFELGFHGWDIRASVDPQAEIRVELRDFLSGIVRQLQARRFQPHPDLDGAFRFEVDGHDWTLRVTNGELEFSSPTTSVRATIRTDASSYLLLATKRRTMDDLRERVFLEGDREQAKLLLVATAYSV